MSGFPHFCSYNTAPFSPHAIRVAHKSIPFHLADTGGRRTHIEVNQIPIRECLNCQISLYDLDLLAAIEHVLMRWQAVGTNRTTYQFQEIADELQRKA